MSFCHPSLWLRQLIAPVVLSVALNGRAQEIPAPVLSLSDALQRVADSSPTLLVERYGERASVALIEQAGLRPNPTLDLSLENALGTGRLSGIDGLEATIQASQLIERGDKRARRLALAHSRRELEANAFVALHAELQADTAAGFVAVLSAQGRVTLATDAKELARQIWETVLDRVDAGIASPAEAAQTRAAFATAKAEMTRANAALTRARSALVARWAGTPSEVSHLAGELRVPETLPELDDFLPNLANHPRLDLAGTVIERQRAALSLEQSRALADVTVGGGLRFFRENSDAAFVAGVSLPLPFRNRNQGNIRAARETLAGAEHSVHAVEVELRATFEIAWQDLIAAHALGETLRRDVLPATVDAHAIVHDAYARGQLPLLDVLDAQRALLSLRGDQLEAAVSYAQALARIEALTDSSFTALSALCSGR